MHGHQAINMLSLLLSCTIFPRTGPCVSRLSSHPSIITDSQTVAELLIDFKEILGSHTGANMADIVWDTLEMYGLTGRVRDLFKPFVHSAHCNRSSLLWPTMQRATTPCSMRSRCAAWSAVFRSTPANRVCDACHIRSIWPHAKCVPSVKCRNGADTKACSYSKA